MVEEMNQLVEGFADGRSRDEIQVRNILDTAMDGIIAMNARQEIVLFNAAAEAIFGWSSNQVIGRLIEMLIPSRFHERHRSDVEAFGSGAVRNRRMGVQRTVMALRSSGEEFPIEASISQTGVNEEKLFTVIVRDVTEAVRYRQQIEQQSQMLDQVSDAVSVVDLDGRITYWNLRQRDCSAGPQKRSWGGSPPKRSIAVIPRYFRRCCGKRMHGVRGQVN